jgi:tungstate transport system ATP-binding protein
MTSAVELRNVSKTYGDKLVLNNINLQVCESEILALLGPNGSGKTTILKILAFIESPTNGEVKLQGEVVNFKKAEQMRLKSTLVFQRTVLFGASVYNNVAYGLKMRKIQKNVIEEEVKNALKLVRLEGFEKRPARKLSGGEQQRVAIARALVLKTPLLLLDEPTANLDPKNAQLLEEVIATVNREMKTTVVIATHNMFQARTLPTRIALMSEGKITEVGSPVEVFGKLSTNLASFAGVDNTFRGNAQVTSEGTTLVDIGNGVQVEVTGQKEGEVSVFVNPQDIILSRSALESSARNVFRGRIVEITDLGSLVKLNVDVGKLFVAQITKRSFAEMGLNLNSEVFVVFKASSVQVV